MTLYSADISKLAQPVKKVAAHKKQRDAGPTTKQTDKEILKREADAEIEQPVKKQRKKKVVEPEPEPLPTPEPEAPPKKKRAPKKKVMEPTPESSPEPATKEVKAVAVEPEVEKVLPPKKRRVQKPKSEPKAEAPISSEPPQWFKKYVEGVKKEEAVHKEEKVPAKQVKLEAQEVAQKSWDNGLTRDRVSNEVDGHMNRMYSMIFARR